ncbi:MAG TPA: hypothetical protein P5280_05695 [Cyclobacteriaceae bacterium]|nr:hypothetical protein [Cyclobacteriaceae bacterium]
MKNILIVVAVSFLISCGGDDDPGFTSLLGSWTYTTPDGKIKTTFDIVGGDTEILKFENQTIAVDGVDGRAEIQVENIAELSIGKVRVNANDVGLVYSFDITFNDLTASDDFTVINVATASYTWPWSATTGPTTNQLENIQILRKE